MSKVALLQLRSWHETRRVGDFVVRLRSKVPRVELEDRDFGGVNSYSVFLHGLVCCCYAIPIFTFTSHRK